MPVPSDISDLSSTASLNSPAGTEEVFPQLDDYLRAHAGFIAELRDSVDVGIDPGALYMSNYGTNTESFQEAIDALPAAGGTIDGGLSAFTGIGELSIGSKRVIWRNFGTVNGQTASAVLPGLQVRASIAASGLHQLEVSPDVKISERDNSTVIRPALYLTKDADAGFAGMGLAKIQWRGTTSAGTLNTDAGRMDGVIVDADPDTFTAVMEINPNANGNGETQPAIKFQDGITIPATEALAAVAITSGGSGYVIGNIVNITSADKQGSGYTTPTVSFTGGGGSGAVALAAVAGGAVDFIAVTNGGSGYTTAPGVTISGGGGSGATATATINADGEVTAITVTAAGSGFTSASCSITGGGGSGGTANPISYNGKIVGAVITAAGSGYTSMPSVSVSGGGGTGAQLLADIVGETVFRLVAPTGGFNATGIVTDETAGAVTELFIQNNGYNFITGETLIFANSTGTGTGIAGTAIVPPRTPFYGHGTANVARKVLVNNRVALEYDFIADSLDAKPNKLNVQDEDDRAAFGDYGQGVVNVAQAYYVRNLPILQYNSTAGTIRQNRDLGHRVTPINNTDSPYTMTGTSEVLLVNATAGNVTVTLPSAAYFGSGYGSRVIIRRTDTSSNTVTIQRAGSDTVNGATFMTIPPAAGAMLTSNGTSTWVSTGGAGDTFRARDFGVMADGSTDDSTAINALIVAVNAIGGGVIELPAGTIKCNIVLLPGIILKGQGRGQNASGVGGTPMPPVYTFAGGGTTLIPQSAASPVIAADGTSGSDAWGEFSIRDLKVSNTGGAIVSGSIGIRASLSRELDISNVEIRNMDTGLQLGGTAAGTTWSFLITNSSIQDCGAYGLLITDRPQTATPGTITALDIRRCTGYGAYVRDMVGMIWNGGTLADNDIGLFVLGDISRALSFNGIQFETNITRGVLIGSSGQAPANVTFNTCSFWEGRGSPYAGSVAVEYVAGVKLSLVNCSWQGFAECVDYTGGGTDLLVINPHYTNCTAFGTVYNLDLGSFSFVVADSTSLLGLSESGLYAKSSHNSTRTNNWHIRPSTQNSPLYSGAAPSGTGTFTQWALYSKSDVDNAGYLRAEVSDASYAAIGTSVTGTGTAVPLRVQLSGGQLGFYGSNGATKQTITGSRGGNAALADLLTKLASLGLITNSTS